ncbi:uncharacterized protein LOC132701771 isoform X2 [Cylas formicarius]|uniref:uncharacterized protein LOC132701771 isoform X2 n=1 Tax=Cylas formicarius TaxID=197179 RepID=UPI00295832B6|nr:uncharacterized protein LOC132701771 isoform X2 [Cylas formicarius]
MTLVVASRGPERLWLDHQPAHKPIADLIVPPRAGNGYRKDPEQSDSSEEDLHYGPGIVNKLRNKYLSLALRESAARPTILRKATSLEHLLDDDDDGDVADKGAGRLFRSRPGTKATESHLTVRYRHGSGVRRQEMKRARSVEAISRRSDDDECGDGGGRRDAVAASYHVANRQSLHEEMLVAAAAAKDDDEGGRLCKKMASENGTEEKPSKYGGRINRPKKLQPLLNEKEKPPSDVVKQARMIFEKRPETRTKKPPQTGDVAAKVDSFNNIIVKAKVASSAAAKKPPIKHTKPVLPDRHKSNTHARPVAKPVILSEEAAKPPRSLDLKAPRKTKRDTNIPSPIPDVSRVDHKNFDGSSSRTTSVSSLCETPDLIMTSSPLAMMSSPTFKRNVTDKFLQVEQGRAEGTNRVYASPSPNGSLNFGDETETEEGFKMISPITQNNITKSVANSSVFNFTSKREVNQSHLPSVVVNKNVSEVKTPVSEPLKIEVNGGLGGRTTALSATEIEKNQKNAMKTAIETKKNGDVVVNGNRVGDGGVANSEVVNRIIVPKRGKPRVEESSSTTAVFNFTSRKDVPDYISKDMSRSPSKPTLPKPGEGGIIIISGATLIESFVDEEEEIMRSLEAPPSPCDVAFVNDNVLIDGKSSLSQSSKRVKMKISFLETADVFEYPSEDSLLLDSPISPQVAQVGHSVPILGGSSLANYTPRTMEEFHLGITRSVPHHQPVISKPDVLGQSSDLLLEEVDNPILFSAGTNSDMLF